MATDFFDDDLVREREAALKIKLDDEGAAIPRDGHIPSSRDLPNRPVGDLTLTHLARHKQEVTEQMVDKAQELDRLRARQEELEGERRLLEEMRQKQEAFDAGRRELKDRLQASLAQLLDETRRAFRDRLDEVLALKEDEWDDANLLDELNRALALLDSVRTDYTKALARIDAIRPSSGDGAPVAERRPVFAGASPEGGQGFGYWLSAGLAFTLPLMVVLAVLAVIWMMLYYAF